MGRYRPSLRSLRACARPVSALRRAEPEARGPGRAARAGRGRAAAPHEQRALEHDGGDERGGGVAGQDGPQEQHGGEVGVVAERAVVADLPVQRHDDERQHHLVHDARAQELRVLEVARGAPLRGRPRAPVRPALPGGGRGGGGAARDRTRAAPGACRRAHARGRRGGAAGGTLASVRMPQYQGLVVSVRTASSFSCSSDTCAAPRQALQRSAPRGSGGASRRSGHRRAPGSRGRSAC